LNSVYVTWQKNAKSDCAAGDKIVASLLGRWDERLPLPQDRSRRSFKVNEFDIHLRDTEADFLRGSAIESYMLAYVDGLKRILDAIKRDAKNQDDILSKLVSISPRRKTP
jgi:hypothetical protein